jgi:hypothetical protein
MTLFLSAASVLFLVALIPFVRYVILYFFAAHRGGHLQSLVAGSVLIMAAFIALALGVIADLIRINRILLEDSLEQQKRHRYATEAPLEVGSLEPAWPARQRTGAG